MAHNLSQKQFTAKDVYKILRIDKNRLFHWINTHRLLEPDIDKGGGRGNRRIFSRKNLLELAIIFHLHHYGIELRMVRQIKDLLDSRSIKAKWENGKWLPVLEAYVGKTRKFNLYDWALDGDIETVIRFYYDIDEETIILYIVTGQELEQWDTRGVRMIPSYLTINLTSIARSIPKVAMKE
jgi:DNA-binding transcriptional MerR regulator